MSDSDEDKALQTWLDLDAIQFPELPEVSQEPDMSAIQLTPEDFSAMISGDTSDGTGTTIARQARTIRRLFTAYFLARAKAQAAVGQARSFAKHIRDRAEEARKAGLTFDAFRALLSQYEGGDISFGKLVESVRDMALAAAESMGANQERARIVAALRVRIAQSKAAAERFERRGEFEHARIEWAVYSSATAAADAIERGEL